MEKCYIFLVIGLIMAAGTSGVSWETHLETVKALSQEKSYRPFRLSEADNTRITADFNCEPSRSPKIPKSVHQLRPGDVKVVAALGDSLTAANGARAKYLPGVAVQYRGISAMIGGDDNLDTVVTLPNVFRKYNEEVYGYSTGTGKVDNPESRLNVAVPASKSHDMPEQAEELVYRLGNDSNVDVKNDWKLVSIFIGGNDVCAWCNDKEQYDPKQFVANIEAAIRILQKIPRVFVSVVGVLNAYQVANITDGVVCDVFHWIACDCGMGDNEKIAELKTINKEYQRLLEESITSGQFDNRDDFTVVYQPFFHDTDLPTTRDGEADITFFSPDCFHFSEKAHIAWAIALWNNMIQPVGEKDTKWFPREKLDCPSEDSPYLFTNVNSKPLLDSPYYELDYDFNPWWEPSTDDQLYQPVADIPDWFSSHDTYPPVKVSWRISTWKESNREDNLDHDYKSSSWITMYDSDKWSTSNIGKAIIIFGAIAGVLLLLVLILGVVFITRHRRVHSEKEDNLVKIHCNGSYMEGRGKP